jgi:hypothetical protein
MKQKEEKVRKEATLEKKYRGYGRKERKPKMQAREHIAEKREKKINKKRRMENRNIKKEIRHCSHFIICMHFEFSREAICQMFF